MVVPIAVPGLISTAMFTFLLASDEFFYALIFTNTLDAKTVPVAIAEFTGRCAVNANGMTAGSILGHSGVHFPALHRQRHDSRGDQGLAGGGIGDDEALKA